MFRLRNVLDGQGKMDKVLSTKNVALARAKGGTEQEYIKSGKLI